MTKVKLEIAHQTPGRIRMKVPAGKGNEPLLAQIREVFGVIPGVREVTANPLTGSLVISYDAEDHDAFHGHFRQHYERHAATPPPTAIDTIASKIEEEAAFLAGHSATARSVVDFCRRLDQELRSATGNAVDLKIVIALGLAGFTFFEIGASAATPMWVTLAIFALNHVAEMHPVHTPG